MIQESATTKFDYFVRLCLYELSNGSDSGLLEYPPKSSLTGLNLLAIYMLFSIIFLFMTVTEKIEQ